MKKLLIASAALAMVAGTAQAQSSVQVYGVLDIGYSETKTTVTGSETDAQNGTTKRTNTGNGDGGLATSRLGFQGSEDLGGGNKAGFRLEYDLVDVGTGGQTFGARESWLNLTNAKVGELKVGRQATLSHSNIVAFSAGMANNTVGAVYSAGTGASTTASPNAASIRPHVVFQDRAVTYVSPSFGGLVLGVSYAKNKTANTIGADKDTDATFSDMSARYNAGKLALGASYQTVKNKSTTGFTADEANAAIGWSSNHFVSTTAAPNATEVKTKLTMLGASYDFGVVQPFALYVDKKADAQGTTANSSGRVYKQKNTEVGVRAPITGKLSAFASAYNGDFSFGSAGTDKSDLDGYQFGAIYSLSKRTAAYAITGKQEMKGTNGDVYKAKVTQTNVGVRHSF
jgi:predicted porin